MIFNRTAVAIGVGFALSVSSPWAFAEEVKEVEAKKEEKSQSEKPMEVLEVTSHPLSAEGIAQPSEVLDGEELAQNVRDSIGDTLNQSAGIRSSDFGVAAGRPVIHGLGGARVKVMEDRIDTLDVSVTSADHATMIDPYIANRIEILKGPSTLIYGSGAIGGVVDVHTGRIPHEVPAEFSGSAQLSVTDNSDRENGVVRLDGGSDNFAWHFDGFYRNAKDYDIPGFTESAFLKQQEEAEGEGEEEGEEVRDSLPGSAFETSGGALGFSFIGDNGFVGFSLSQLDANYGLPGGHGHHEEHGEHEGEEHEEEEHGDEHGEEGTPILDLAQTRLDVEAGWNQPFAGFESLNFRFGLNDYEHQEIEPSGEVATNFKNDAWESRIELVHAPIAGWRGAFGLQFGDREFSAVGEEAFVSPVDSNSFGAFWVVEKRFDNLSLETGVRVNSDELNPSDTSLPSRDFTTISASVGTIIDLSPAWQLDFILGYSERAPVGEELYSNGPHLATNTFEIGNSNLNAEEAVNFATSLRYVYEDTRFEATLYRNDFDNYIYQFNTGTEEDELPVFQYAQSAAELTGLDVTLEMKAVEWNGGDLKVAAIYDTVDADLDAADSSSIPRLPSDRYTLRFSAEMNQMVAQLGFTRVSAQNDVADLELPTEAYNDLNAYFGYDLDTAQFDSTIFLRGRNLTDEEQRNHVSFIKDLAPRPGRSIEAGIRFRF